MANSFPVRRRHLVYQLKRLRVEAGLTQDDVWKDLGWSRNKIQRIEKGDFVRIKAGDVIAMCSLYQVGKEETDELVEIARQSRQHKPWWLQYDEVLPGAFIGLESEATMIQEFSVSLVPGLFQTRGYIEGLMKRSEGITVAREEFQPRVEMRLERQRSVLERSAPPTILSVIDEAALRREVGGTDVIREQVQHLLELSKRPNIELQVLPYSAGAHAGGGFPFTILGFEGGAGSVVYIETFSDGFYLEDDTEVTRHRLVFSRMQGAAMSVEDSVTFLEGLV